MATSVTVRGTNSKGDRVTRLTQYVHPHFVETKGRKRALSSVVSRPMKQACGPSRSSKATDRVKRKPEASGNGRWKDGQETEEFEQGLMGIAAHGFAWRAGFPGRGVVPRGSSRGMPGARAVSGALFHGINRARLQKKLRRLAIVRPSDLKIISSSTGTPPPSS